MKKLKLFTISLIARFIRMFVRLSGRGSGTALPGYVVQRIFPSALNDLLSQIPNIIVISGTNGKTTTQTILRYILDENKSINAITNSAGANLTQGILSELLKRTDKLGSLDYTHAIFEVEEGTLPKIVEMLKPTVIAITNLYRDQLDAYGEVDITEKYLRKAIELSPQAKIILNGDDPRVSHLCDGLDNEKYFVSLPEEFRSPVHYEGKFEQLKMPENILTATKISILNDLTCSFDLVGEIAGKKQNLSGIHLKTVGYFHIYNALFAISIANLIGASKEEISAGCAKFEPAFGRGELIESSGMRYRVLLIKNPAGLSLNLDILRKINNLKLMIILNDLTADGKDVSWIWDANLEYLNEVKIDFVVCTGRRAQDMRVRLKYALEKDNSPQSIITTNSISEAIKFAEDNSDINSDIYVLSTYTGMLKFRKLMGKEIP